MIKDVLYSLVPSAFFLLSSLRNLSSIMTRFVKEYIHDNVGRYGGYTIKN